MNAHPRIPRPLRLRTRAAFALLPALLVLAACAQSSPPAAQASIAAATPPPAAVKSPARAAVFAGGCFWCMEPPFDKLPGVISTTSGYTGGHVANPTYEQVSAGGTGHVEAVKVTYDPSRVSYAKLLDVFWHNIDPVAVDRQFCDAGTQYRSAIFPIGDAQRREAEASKAAQEKDPRFKQPIATRIEAAAPFYAAEGYHQDYYEKNPIRYKYYRFRCGRDQRLQEIWGNPG
ncbi:MAG: peptide-methionine (S)-S-oxide reductase MsrA [Luteimonas sp.]|nr:peptide-methionine (S)-S-oxide reductase MsrA [Luteimonas sp.]